MIIEPTFCGSRFTTGRLLAIEDFTFFTLPSCSEAALETDRRCFSIVILESNVTPNITRSSDSFSTVEFRLYRRPDLDDGIFDCLLSSITAVQTDNVRASFPFVPDLNSHHREWLGSTTINRHRVAAVDFATVSDCGQLVVSPTHATCGPLDLLMTDVPDQVRIAVVASIGNSDHSSLSIVISMAQVVPNSWCQTRCQTRGAKPDAKLVVPNLFQKNIFFLKHHIKSTGIQSGAIQDLPWRTAWLASGQSC